MTSLTLDWKSHYIYWACQNGTPTITSSFAIFRVGFSVENRKTLIVGRPTQIVESETIIDKILLDPVHNNILYYTHESSIFETLQLSAETHQLSRVVMSYTGAVIDHQVLQSSDSCNQTLSNGILSEFTLKDEGNNVSSIYFVESSKFVMLKANFENGVIVKCEEVTRLGNEMMKDFSFTTSTAGDQLFWINKTESSVWSFNLGGENQLVNIKQFEKINSFLAKKLSSDTTLHFFKSVNAWKAHWSGLNQIFLQTTHRKALHFGLDDSYSKLK